MTFEIRVPGSTSNLGSGFDCFGLALKLYLTVRATVVPNAVQPCHVTTTGATENEALPRNAVNLIYRAMSFAARSEGIPLPPVEIIAHNEIPLASGLGSSAAAIIAGIKLAGLITGKDISNQSPSLKDIPTTSPRRCTAGSSRAASVAIRQCFPQSSIGPRRFEWSWFRLIHNCRHMSRARRFSEPSVA